MHGGALSMSPNHRAVHNPNSVGIRHLLTYNAACTPDMTVTLARILIVKRAKWYKFQRNKQYKYLLLRKKTFKTKIRPKAAIAFPKKTKLVNLGKNGILIIKKGYAWNGATAFPDLKTMMRATLAHDALYKLMRKKKLKRKWRLEADRLLRKICIADGMPRPLAWVIYFAVRAIGWARVQ